ncbi:MAG: class I SAM-dependent methyltransferase [Sphingobium sp.]|nr:class I SAM-dependent methyltransferase [Sphingobium sp.]
MQSMPLANTVARLKRNWRALRSGLWFRPAPYRRMERLYLLEDPWRLASPREHERFALTNAVIAQIAPNCGSLLEIGSGEGEQTAHLLKVAGSVTGIEVSEAAVNRARSAAPHAEYLVGCAEDAGHLLGERRFDIVTACEMLYYAPDAARVLDTLKGLAPRILVTAYERRAQGLAPHFTGAGWSRLEDMVVDGTRWHCHLWQAPEPASA